MVSMLITKPKLSLEGQIEHLKEKGVLFNIMDEESAKEYLTQHNNYFKLTAYRKNYDKHPDEENKGKYINLMAWYTFIRKISEYPKSVSGDV